MTTGAPIDASIRRTSRISESRGGSVPDSRSNLDPAPQLIMTPGSEQFSFQYDDGLGDGRDQYEGYSDAGGGAGSTTPGGDLFVTDTITADIEKPKNRTYTLVFGAPYPIEVLSAFASAFGAGSGTIVLPEVRTYEAGENITVVISGVSTSPAPANLKIRVVTRTNQVV